MNFANMTQAERMKASGLIGLIVIMLFFVIHTVLGALAPKVPTATASPTEAVAQNPGAPPAQTASSDTVPVPGAPPSPNEAFPLVKDTGPGDPGKLTGRPEPAEENDPFVPLRPAENRKMAAPPPSPFLEVKPTTQPHFTGGPGLPGAFGGGQPAGGMGGFQTSMANPDPEIKVVGVVEGDQSIATIEVGGKARNVRPGESLARSYRLESVFGDGVRVRHEKRLYAIRVGNAINESSKTHLQ
jgi:hypothetical protein